MLELCIMPVSVARELLYNRQQKTLDLKSRGFLAKQLTLKLAAVAWLH